MEIIQSLKKHNTPNDRFSDFFHVGDRSPWARLYQRFKVRESHGAVWLINELNEREDQWTIVIESAVALGEIARSDWGPSNVDLGRKLLDRGIRFRTVAFTALPRGLPRTISTVPRVYPVGWRPGKEEYHEYIRERRKILRGPRGAAALRQGGIIFRIAMEELEPEAALLGPRLQESPVWKLDPGIGNDTSGYDDELTELETDIICGVYKVLNSK